MVVLRGGSVFSEQRSVLRPKTTQGFSGNDRPRQAKVKNPGKHFPESALRANNRVKQDNELKSPSQSNILVGDKAADKQRNLWVNHLLFQEISMGSPSKAKT